MLAQQFPDINRIDSQELPLELIFENCCYGSQLTNSMTVNQYVTDNDRKPMDKLSVNCQAAYQVSTESGSQHLRSFH